jgi:hypothetical protein
LSSQLVLSRHKSRLDGLHAPSHASIRLVLDKLSIVSVRMSLPSEIVLVLAVLLPMLLPLLHSLGFAVLYQNTMTNLDLSGAPTFASQTTSVSATATSLAPVVTSGTGVVTVTTGGSTIVQTATSETATSPPQATGTSVASSSGSTGTASAVRSGSAGTVTPSSSGVSSSGSVIVGNGLFVGVLAVTVAMAVAVGIFV